MLERNTKPLLCMYWQTKAKNSSYNFTARPTCRTAGDHDKSPNVIHGWGIQLLHHVYQRYLTAFISRRTLADSQAGTTTGYCLHVISNILDMPLGTVKAMYLHDISIKTFKHATRFCTGDMILHDSTLKTFNMLLRSVTAMQMSG